MNMAVIRCCGVTPILHNPLEKGKVFMADLPPPILTEFVSSCLDYYYRQTKKIFANYTVALYLFDPDSDPDPDLQRPRFRDRYRYRYRFLVPEYRSVRITDLPPSSIDPEIELIYDSPSTTDPLSIGDDSE
jgi:hypothetical protein